MQITWIFSIVLQRVLQHFFLDLIWLYFGKYPIFSELFWKLYEIS